VVEELAHLVDADDALQARVLERVREVLAVLAAGGVGAVRARGDGDELAASRAAFSSRFCSLMGLMPPNAR
jgi:hypothetical protein